MSETELLQPLLQYVITTSLENTGKTIHWYFHKLHLSIIGFLQVDDRKVKACEFWVEREPRNDGSIYHELYHLVCEFAVTRGILKKSVAYKP